MEPKTASECRTEIKQRLEAADLIEKKFPDPEKMPQEDLQQVQKLLGEIDGLEAKLSTLESAEERRDRIRRDLDRAAKPSAHNARPRYGDDGDPDQKARRMSPGAQFVDDRQYREMKQSGIFNSALSRVEFAVQMADGTSLLDWADAIAGKALLRGGSSSSGQAFVLEDHQPGFIDILQREINVLDLVPRIPTTSDTIEYVREDTF